MTELLLHQELFSNMKFILFVEFTTKSVIMKQSSFLIELLTMNLIHNNSIFRTLINSIRCQLVRISFVLTFRAIRSTWQTEYTVINNIYTIYLPVIQGYAYKIQYKTKNFDDLSIVRTLNKLHKLYRENLEHYEDKRNCATT